MDTTPQPLKDRKQTMASKLQIIIASTRPGRVGPVLAKWLADFAAAQGAFDSVELVDLLDFKLPVYDEPKHPRLQQYEHDHTKGWSKSVASGDAYVFVTPEYNYGPTPALVNALNYVYSEWNYKPASFLSYGGISGGLRAVQVTKDLLTTLKVVPIMEAVVAPFPWESFKDGAFVPNDTQVGAAKVMVSELKRWSDALKTLRA